MVLMNGIRQMEMIRVHGIGRLKYTCYRVYTFFKQKFMLFVKNDAHSVYRVSKKRRFCFFCCSFHRK